MNTAVYAAAFLTVSAGYLLLRSRDTQAAYAPADSLADQLRNVEYSVAAAVMTDALQLSPAGLEAIKRHESGAAGPQLDVYLDVAGYKTIGYGHKLTAGEDFETITEAQAAQLLEADLRTAINAVVALVTVPITQRQFDALVSLVFNIGVGAFRRSTLLALLNAGDVDGAAAQFPRWNRAGGRVVAGLANRRAAERAMFEAA